MFTLYSRSILHRRYRLLCFLHWRFDMQHQHWRSIILVNFSCFTRLNSNRNSIEHSDLLTPSDLLCTTALLDLAIYLPRPEVRPRVRCAFPSNFQLGVRMPALHVIQMPSLVIRPRETLDLGKWLHLIFLPLAG